MDKVIKDILDSNQGFIRDQQRLLTMLDEHPTIPDLFDYLFTGSPITTRFSHFFIEKSHFDKELFELNKALCDECNKRIKLMGLGNFAYSFFNYNGLYLGISNRIPSEKLPSFVMLPYGTIMEYNLYNDIASRGVLKIVNPVQNLSISVFSSKVKPLCDYKWDKEHRFAGSEEDILNSVILQNKLSRTDKKYIVNSISRDYGYYRWAVWLQLRKFISDSAYQVINRDESIQSAKEYVDSKLPYVEKIINEWYIEPMSKLMKEVFHKQVTYEQSKYKYNYYGFPDSRRYDIVDVRR